MGVWCPFLFLATVMGSTLDLNAILVHAPARGPCRHIAGSPHKCYQKASVMNQPLEATSAGAQLCGTGKGKAALAMGGQ